MYKCKIKLRTYEDIIRIQQGFTKSPDIAVQSSKIMVEPGNSILDGEGRIHRGHLRTGQQSILLLFSLKSKMPHQFVISVSHEQIYSKTGL